MGCIPGKTNRARVPNSDQADGGNSEIARANSPDNNSAANANVNASASAKAKVKANCSNYAANYSAMSPPVNHRHINVTLEQRKLPPIPPQQPEKKTIIYRAMYDFKGLTKDDIDFVKGDRLVIDEDSQKIDDWWTAFNMRTGRSGYVPSNYLCKDDDSPKNQEWWFDIDHKDSDKLLMSAGIRQGYYLIRESRDKVTFVLSVRDHSSVKHYKIRKLDGGGYYISPRRKFATMVDLLNHYKLNTDGLCTLLTSICPKTPPSLHFMDLEVDRDAVSMTVKLGVGHFGEVWKGKLHKMIDVAVKTLKPGTMSPEDFLEEAKSMHNLRHRKLVELMAVCSTEEPILIVTELMTNGSLLDYVRKDEGKTINFVTVVDIASQVAEGMGFLESKNFIHRDLRAANILVGSNMNVKIADFGLARILHDEEFYNATEKTKFPVKWTAPEAASYRKFSIKSDVWSFGVLLYEIISFGKTPYPGMSGTEVLQNVDKGYRMSKPTSPISYPHVYYEVMLKCWHWNPRDRPTFEYLHALFDNFAIETEEDYDETEHS